MTETNDPTTQPQAALQQEAPAPATATTQPAQTDPAPGSNPALAAAAAEPQKGDVEPEEFDPEHGDHVAFKSSPGTRLVVRAVRDDGTFDVQEDLDSDQEASPTGPRWYQSVAKDQLQPWNGAAQATHG